MSTAFLFLLMWQSGLRQPGFPSQIQIPAADGVTGAIPDLPDPSAAGSAYEEREFAQHVDGLLRALNDFAESYRTGLVDLKKVKAVRSAVRALEKSEWFKRQPAKNQAERGARE